MDFVVIDVEEAGFEVGTVHQIGAVKVLGSKLEAEPFNRLMHPGCRRIDPYKRKKHKRGVELLRLEEGFADVWPVFLRYVDGLPLIAYASGNEQKMLRAACRRNGLGRSVPPMLDAQKLAGQYRNRLVKGGSLQEAVKDFDESDALGAVNHQHLGLRLACKIVGTGYENALAHDALYDAKVCAQFILGIAAEQPGISTVEELFAHYGAL